MSTFDSLTFGEPSEIQAESGSLIVLVPKNITDARQLLVELNKRLSFPGYFGFNWNALSDCMRDFHWVSQRHIFLVHEDLPALSNADLMQYIEVLDESVLSWKTKKNHSLVVVFPESCRRRIEQVADEIE
jgi:RNAse (barnase) inhibitor barstar